MKKRINISIDRDLHERAKAYARESKYTDFSSLLSELLVEKMREDLALERAAAKHLGIRSEFNSVNEGSRQDRANQGTRTKGRAAAGGTHPKRQKTARGHRAA